MCIKEPKCTKCKYYDADNPDIYPVCKEFSDGIPRDIWGERINHEKPYPGDNGIQFEPSVDKE